MVEHEFVAVKLLKQQTFSFQLVNGTHPTTGLPTNSGHCVRITESTTAGKTKPPNAPKLHAMILEQTVVPFWIQSYTTVFRI